LDNSGRQIPIDSTDLKVRKTYNTSTDREDYYLNGKHIRQTDLFNLFESGGFSLQSHSQFQIIQQGQLQSLVQRGEQGFLDMLTEVTGTRVFDQKLENLEKGLQDAAVKKDALHSVLREIELKLEGLSVDKETFEKIEALEMRKKALQKYQLL
jgi:structural maintenance of chromosome 3 (chondroitin sulfate proteoglycan 6)